MNYRHHFHAGNFADLVKHAALLGLAGRLTAPPAPLLVLDTHAGAGLYDLTGEMARKSGEAALGVVRLMADSGAPPVFAPLKAAVARANPDGGLRYYPGSPWLVASLLRPADGLIAWELRPDDAQALTATLKSAPAAVEVVCADGFNSAPGRVSARQRTLVLIDPPFERADDYARIVACQSAILARNGQATVMVWTPLKDLETFDRLLRAMEAAGAPSLLVAETRLRGLDDPMRLNGCALIVANAPPGLAAELTAACDWIVAALGEAGGEARVWTL